MMELLYLSYINEDSRHKVPSLLWTPQSKRIFHGERRHKVPSLLWTPEKISLGQNPRDVFCMGRELSIQEIHWIKKFGEFFQKRRTRVIVRCENAS